MNFRPISSSDRFYPVTEGVQDMLLQKMALRHIKHFQLKESEETAKAERSLWPPLLPYFPETGGKRGPVRDALPVMQRSILTFKDKGMSRRFLTKETCWIPPIYYNRFILANQFIFCSYLILLNLSYSSIYHFLQFICIYNNLVYNLFYFYNLFQFTIYLFTIYCNWPLAP